MHTARLSASGTRPDTRLRALLAAETVMGLIAVPCGVLLIVNGLGMSEDVLDRSPFDTFLVPGLLLAAVVGGSLLGAAWLAWRRHPRAGIAGVAAGSILLGWIVIEAVMISGGRMLQAIVLVWALVIIALAWPLMSSSQASLSSREAAS
jgi:hypothetical protein